MLLSKKYNCNCQDTMMLASHTGHTRLVSMTDRPTKLPDASVTPREHRDTEVGGGLNASLV